MAHLPIRPGVAAALVWLFLACAVISPAAPARADAVAYLINVTVRPGYNFASAEAALSYGHGVCDKITAGDDYAAVMAAIKTDFANPDEFQASYLIGQAAEGLCPAAIWQLRDSADHYRSPVNQPR